MEKKTSKAMFFRLLLKIGGLFITLSFVTLILITYKNLANDYFHYYFWSGIVCIIIAMVPSIFNVCKSKKQEENVETPPRNPEEKEKDYQREVEKHCQLREHEERMAIIKALGTNYDKQNADAIQAKLNEIVKILYSIKRS